MISLAEVVLYNGDVYEVITYEAEYQVSATVGYSTDETVPYTGEYTFVPTAEGFDIPTKKRTLYEDISITEIPYSSTDNESGGLTVSIVS